MTVTSANDLKTHLGQFLDRAQTEPVCIRKSGRDVAVLISKTEFDRLCESPLRRPRRRGFAKHLFAGIDIDKLLATPVEGFEE
jgi:prevent-host-death family protein